MSAGTTTPILRATAALVLSALVMLGAAACAGTPLSTGSATPTLSAGAMTATALCIVPRPGSGVIAYDLFGTPTPAYPVPERSPTPAPTFDRPSGDAVRGQVVFTDVARCATCHNTADDATFVGPSLRTIGTLAAYRKAGMDAQTYLRWVIIDPDRYSALQQNTGIMPSTYQRTLTPEQMDDLVAYLLTLTV
jgi:mono/diheme cytochrome c family protein